MSLKVCHSVGSLSTGCLTILVDDEEESDKVTREKRKILRKLPLPMALKHQYVSQLRLAWHPSVRQLLTPRKPGGVDVQPDECLRLLTCVVGVRFFILFLRAFPNAGKDA